MYRMMEYKVILYIAVISAMLLTAMNPEKGFLKLFRRYLPDCDICALSRIILIVGIAPITLYSLVGGFNPYYLMDLAVSYGISVVFYKFLSS